MAVSSVVVGFYGSSGAVLESLLVLGPDDMEPWISRIERYMAPDFMIGERISGKLEMEDLHVICGEKDAYVLEDAQALYKRQWSQGMYTARMDLPDGYSPNRMLEILRLRARYLLDRGSTLNNPRIPRTLFAAFADRAASVTLGSSELRRRIRRTIAQTALASAQLSRLAAAYAADQQ